MKRIFLFFLPVFMVPATCFAQSNQTDTLTITTYYPSPYGVYGTLEVKKGMAVGGASSATVTSLKPGQLYVGNSTILNPLPADPDPSVSKAGQVIYNRPDKMLKFFDGTKWVNATGGSEGACQVYRGKNLGMLAFDYTTKTRIPPCPQPGQVIVSRHFPPKDCSYMLPNGSSSKAPYMFGEHWGLNGNYCIGFPGGGGTCWLTESLIDPNLDPITWIKNQRGLPLSQPLPSNYCVQEWDAICCCKNTD